MINLTEDQIKYTIKNMILCAKCQIEDCREYESAVETLEEAECVLDGDLSVARSYWVNVYHCTPLDVLNEIEIDILKCLGLIESN